MFEHAVYSVISPEGCASILWRTAEKASEAATAMQVTAADLLRLGVIDRIVEEPVGGAHRDPAKARSEEHTSELQSLMRISYAVFCLKKKNNSHLSTQHQRE